MTENETPSPTRREQVLIDLLASFISTNGVGVEVGFPISRALVMANTFAIDQASGSVLAPSENTVFDAITAQEYPRGEYVARLVAGRIVRSIEQINSLGGSAYLDQLGNMNYAETRVHLLPLYGVGEKFVDAYCLLAGIEKG
jgi:hypothetical protein